MTHFISLPMKDSYGFLTYHNYVRLLGRCKSHVENDEFLHRIFDVSIHDNRTNQLLIIRVHVYKSELLTCDVFWPKN